MTVPSKTTAITRSRFIAPANHRASNCEGRAIARVTLRGDAGARIDANTALQVFRTTPGFPQQFDGHGNYTFGLSEQSMFHEIDVDKIDYPRGMDITVVTTAHNNEEGRALLRELGFPFKK